STSLALAEWQNGQNADLVLGQPDFDSSGTGTTTATIMHEPGDVAIDPTTGFVFVADTIENRVLRFASFDSLMNGDAAVGVLGQANLSSSNDPEDATASSMDSPQGIHVDSNGTLWVADTSNHRVLRFLNASTVADADGAPADLVLGQETFAGDDSGNAVDSMNGPFDVVSDGSGNVYVSDRTNNRVLRFSVLSNPSNGMDADGVLGQVDFDSRLSPNPPTAASMNRPNGVALGTNGELWVADPNNNRVLRFDTPSTQADSNGADADGVLGQTLFTTATGGTDEDSLDDPRKLTVAPNGDLWVIESIQHRALRFPDAANLPNGSDATNVLGQTLLTTSAFGGGMSGLSFPTGITAVSNKTLFISDGGNNRVLRFTDDDTVPPVASPTDNSALIASLQRKIKKLKKRVKTLRQKGKRDAARRLQKRVRKFTKQLRAL
ncbi:MAG: NHL repeat-containing protein, partial [Verrucomicrobiota bacterium]